MVRDTPPAVTSTEKLVNVGATDPSVIVVTVGAGSIVTVAVADAGA